MSMPVGVDRAMSRGGGGGYGYQQQYYPGVYPHRQPSRGAAATPAHGHHQRNSSGFTTLVGTPSPTMGGRFSFGSGKKHAYGCGGEMCEEAGGEEVVELQGSEPLSGAPQEVDGGGVGRRVSGDEEEITPGEGGREGDRPGEGGIKGDGEREGRGRT